MKKSILKPIALLMLLAIVSFSCNPKTGEEGSSETTLAEVEPDTIFENDYAKVYKVVLEPGQEIPAHDGKARLIYSLSDYSVDWSEQGKSEGIKSWKKGDTHFHEAGEHAAKNSGNTTAEWLVFVRQGADLPACEENTLADDVNTATPDFARVAFDNDNIRLTEVTLPSGQAIPSHAGINRIIYSLSNYQINYASNESAMEEKEFASGDIHWHDACQHSLENSGNTEANFLVVSYKN